MRLLPEIRDSTEAAWCCFKWMGIIALLGMLFGCTSIEKQVENFPQDLRVTIHDDASMVTIITKCLDDMPAWQKLLGFIPMACTVIDLDAHTCNIYGDSNREHELQHCKGGDHDGIMQAYFDSWLARKSSP